MRTKTRKILSIVLAFAMIVALAVPVFAQGDDGKGMTPPEPSTTKMIIEISEKNQEADAITPCESDSFDIHFEIIDNNDGFKCDRVVCNIISEKDENFVIGKDYVLQLEIYGSRDLAPNAISIFFVSKNSEDVIYEKCKADVLEFFEYSEEDPHNKVSIKYTGRTWKNVKNVAVHNGSFASADSGSGFLPKGIFPVGSRIIIVPQDPTLFDHWEVIKGNLNLTEEQKKTSDLTFVMPNSDLEIKAVDKLIKTSADKLTEIPDRFSSRDKLNTVEKIKNFMMDSLKEKYKDLKDLPENQIEFYDVYPMLFNEGTGKYDKVTSPDIISRSDIFSVDGKCRILLPYPKGSNKDDFNFYVAHLITMVNEPLVGTVETPEVIKRDDGIEVTVTGFSPFAIAWEKIPESVKDTTKKVTKEEHKKEKIADTDASFSSLLIALPAVSAAGAVVIAVKNKKQDEMK